tara:strand:+ start:212 stop:520 length:309 start_codon:yes stop_codon:yes gene_type:complete
MSILSFEAYKEKGIIKYINSTVIQEPTIDQQEMTEQEFKKELDDIAEVMEMSTDELMAELSIRFESQLGLREVSEEKLVEELTHRLIAIEYILALAISRYGK